MEVLSILALLLLTMVGYSSGATIAAGRGRSTAPVLLDLGLLLALWILALLTSPDLGKMAIGPHLGDRGCHPGWLLDPHPHRTQTGRRAQTQGKKRRFLVAVILGGLEVLRCRNGELPGTPASGSFLLHRSRTLGPHGPPTQRSSPNSHNFLLLPLDRT